MSQNQHADDCPPDLIPTRASLLGRLKDWEDHESWRDFFETYWRLIYGFAVQRGLTHEEAQETVQETVVAVAKNISKFRYDPKTCSFKTWLLDVTRSKIANQFARRARHPPAMTVSGDDSSTTGLVNRIPDERVGQWEQVWESEWQKNLMEAAIRRVKRRVSIEQFQMFDLFVFKQWPAGDVAKTLGVTVGHVYVAKHRVSKLIRKEIENLEATGV
ncbi:MAG TPA: sigma-70 family RNA polymerase sigma factor [Verrucomicrobiae bacterium]|nr:sigma-70 family RNA polymerase sigma factor [Verrucomicrobiae bacterium]